MTDSPRPGDPDPRPTRSPDLVRPFIVTRGRTRADSVVALELDTQLQLREGADTDVAFESARIVRLCAAGPMSLAELAGRLTLPTGVVSVLAGDLVGSGHLEVHHTDSVDVELSMLERLIERVREL